jgi:hypothetical protein
MIFVVVFLGDFYDYFMYRTLYNTVSQAVEIRCVSGCWDQTQDRCNVCIVSEAL